MIQKKMYWISMALILMWGLVSNSVLATERVYWIVADEVDWDYAPSFPGNLMSGQALTPDQRVFVEDGIGRIYRKSVYREYTEGFSALKQRSTEEQHLGILGPIISAAVGEKITVHFKNNTRFPASIHPHGVFYNKAHEGTPYNDGDKQKADDSVAPGETYTYRWDVPHRAGPGKNDPSSIVWIYHGHVDEPADTNSGLIGPIIITRHDSARKDGSPSDVDREFVSLFTVFDENVSLYLDVNCGGSCPEGEDFEESNLMHGINGLVYGNNQGYEMHKGERVRWHVLGMGTARLIFIRLIGTAPPCCIMVIASM